MTTASTATPKRRRVWLVLLGLLAAVVVVGVATLAIRREMAARRLAAVTAELDRTEPNWRLDDLERSRAAVPDGENFAVALANVMGRLKRPSVVHTQAIADPDTTFLVPNVRLSEQQESSLRNIMAAYSVNATEVLVLADFPRGRHPITHAPDAISTLLRHADTMTQVNSWALAPLGLLAAQDGDAARALAVFRAQLNCGRSLRNEPILISQLIRTGYRRRAVRGLERLLGHVTHTAEHLAAVRRELTAELADDPWPVAARGERAMADRFFNALRSGAVKASSAKSLLMQSYKPTPAQRVGDWLNDHVAMEVDPAHAFVLELLNRVVATEALPWHERAAAVAALHAEWLTGPELARWLAGIDVPKRLRGLVLDQARLRCAVVAVAAEEYCMKTGAWPASLAALGGALPDDPYTGKPLLFKRLADGVAVYSVGPNLRDDGGELAKDDGNIPKDGDIGFRLWDVPRRNQPPAGGGP